MGQPIHWQLTTFFNVNEETKILPHDKAELFHHIVVQLLYLCRRISEDIQTAIPFCKKESNAQVRMTIKN